MTREPSIRRIAGDRDDALLGGKAIQIRPPDGCSIRGTLFAHDFERHHDVAVVLCSGAGVPAKFYSRFARYLASCGIATLTYDYRGIGESRPRTLRGFTASIEDWATLDCAAAIAWLAEHGRARRLIGVSHSIGALILGGAGNASRLAGCVMVAPHTAYFGDYLPRYRLPMAITWHGLMPALTLGLGYFPGKLLRLGEDIPKEVAMQWARRIRPGVRLGDNAERTHHLIQAFASLKLDAVTITASDDGFATRAGVARAKSYFPNVSFTDCVIQPGLVGLREVGHFGYFRMAAREPIWPVIARAIVQLADCDNPRTFIPPLHAGAVAR